MTNEVALTKSEKYVESANRALERQMKLGLGYPKNFDVHGALAFTALKIMDSPYSSTIKPETIIDAMIRVAQKGLDPRKDQLYILPNKKGEIMLMESYFGYEKLAYDIDEINKGSVYSDVVRKGETVDFTGRTLEHKKTLDTLDNEIIGAYAKVMINGEELALYMTVYQISLSWSKTNSLDYHAITEERSNGYKTWTVKVADTSVIEKGKLTAFNKNQKNHPVEMAKRTVIKNLLKPIIKSHAEASIAASFDASDRDSTIIKEADVIEEEVLEIEESQPEIQEIAESEQEAETQEAEELTLDI